MSIKKVMVFEFCRSGGMARVPVEQIPSNILREGSLMLKAISDDLRRIPQLQVITILDGRIEDHLTRRRGARCVTPDSDWREEWPKLGEQADLCLAIAPESDRRLEECVAKFAERGISVLASDSTFLHHTSDKFATFQAWQAAGIFTPPTVLPSEEGWYERLKQQVDSSEREVEGWILKPRDGVGCDGVQWIGSTDRLRWICETLSHPDRWLVQPKIAGSSGSVSLIAGKFRVQLPPMRQSIEHMLGFTEYLGGEGPWVEAEMGSVGEPLNPVDRWLDAIPGVPWGWVGIDFLRTAQGEQIPIEINARLTTSYIGLRELVANNLSLGLLRCAQNRRWKPRLANKAVRFTTDGRTWIRKIPRMPASAKPRRLQYTDSIASQESADHPTQAATGVHPMKKGHRYSPKKFRVPEGEKLRLHKIPTAAGDDVDDKDAATEAMAADVTQLREMQERLFAANSDSLLIILQGMDASGKDGVIRHVMNGCNPQGSRAYSFKAPNSEELEHHFLWRPMRYLPERGMISIFNRSYYEEVLVVRVHPEFLKPQRLPKLKKPNDLWEMRFEEIRQFEETLQRSGTRVLKFFLHVSQAEQKRRLLERLKDPTKQWKFNERDLEERKLWETYQSVYNEMMPATSTKQSPWYIIPADNKWYCRSVIADLIVQYVEGLNLEYPKVTEELQAKYETLAEQLEKEGPPF